MKTKTIGQCCVAALLGGAALILSASSASAYVVCNDRGDCWHAAEKYADPIHVTYYDDNWDWKAHNYRWHEVDAEPGYWDSDTNRYVVTKKTTTTTTTTSTAPQP
ncbi:MAG TPA: hypothetical protein VGG10_17280 [Rhizomicrobium sp.]|jgi:hypothetical protein